MLFSSTTFLFVFLSLILVCYYAVPRMFKNAVLLVFSLVFYAWGEPVYVFLMLASIAVAYITGLLCGRDREKSKVPLISVISAIVWNIGLLLFFKYTNFFIDNLNSIFDMKITPLGLTLPIGISFYSFQTLSYVIDVYRGKVKPQRNFLNLATYVTLFPQLIAGPIVRYQTIEEQLSGRKETLDKFARGVRRFAIGLGKKVILANNIGALFEEISNTPQSELSVASSWLGIIAFTFQIYFDFSGYSDMAIGLGRMFGFEFLENFNYPYISDSITDFWRRWHISLSTWFRDYVYIPLGGNRKGKLRQCVNIMVVWFLTGFWHGASWNFMIWGVYFGIILLCEKLFLLKALGKLPAAIRHIYALLFIVIGWGIFAFDDTSKLIQNFKNMFGLGGLPFWGGKYDLYWIAGSWKLLVILVIASVPLFMHLGKKLTVKLPAVYGCVIEPVTTAALLIVSTAYLAGSSFNPFLYFRF
ncbi:MAG: MBOAT family protein [Ruminococcus sp.]|nr:MBOAT family protein [Ruminococcus sp.]